MFLFKNSSGQGKIPGQEKREEKKKKAEETVAFANPSPRRGEAELQTCLPPLGKREARRRTREYHILTNLLHTPSGRYGLADPPEPCNPPWANVAPPARQPASTGENGMDKPEKPPCVLVWDAACCGTDHKPWLLLPAELAES